MAGSVDLSFATRPGNVDAVGDLIQELSILQRDLNHGDENIRQTMLVKARTLVHSLQTPREIMVQHTWADPGLNAVLITGVDIGLWKLMVKNGADKAQKVEDLARSLGMDPILLGRLLRHAAAMGHLKEIGQDEYKLSSFTRSLSLDVIGDGYLALLGGIGRSPIEFYKFLRQTQWKNPTDASHTAMHVSYDTKLPNCFEYLRSIGLGPQTNNHMGGYRQGRLPWMHPSLYPVEDTLFTGSDESPDAPLLVDVAGGLGHDIHEFKKFYPIHPGKLILQDLPVVINDVKDIDPSIELMPHDFLTEQPVKGARAYFMHSILHDWPDDQTSYIRVCHTKNGAYWEATAGDILMMTQLSALERTEDNWYQLIEGSGLNLKIVKFWKCGVASVENLIECELV
ncbi:O-methyltransferase [Fusarium pseudoanthophilum]|uniref:O-methyltransferase n=1 Tax=Fusarium pseudoanthophilum TaxID=48495 RepID=A0A8H5LBT6_9HYPO|nr:O-methyltransferase [Fusarium pseudoanthophilum]